MHFNCDAGGDKHPRSPIDFFIAGGRGQWSPLADTNSSVTYNRVA